MNKQATLLSAERPAPQKRLTTVHCAGDELSTAGSCQPRGKFIFAHESDRDVRALAREFGAVADSETVARLMQDALVRYQTGARVLEYVPLFAYRAVRQQLIAASRKQDEPDRSAA